MGKKVGEYRLLGDCRRHRLEEKKAQDDEKYKEFDEDNRPQLASPRHFAKAFKVKVYDTTEDLHGNVLNFREEAMAEKNFFLLLPAAVVQGFWGIAADSIGWCCPKAFGAEGVLRGQTGGQRVAADGSLPAGKPLAVRDLSDVADEKSGKIPVNLPLPRRHLPENQSLLFRYARICSAWIFVLISFGVKIFSMIPSSLTR